MVIVPLILGAAALFVLVYGTNKTVETHFVEGRPATLGGERAPTGDVYERESRRNIYAAHPEPDAAEPREVVSTEPVAPDHAEHTEPRIKEPTPLFRDDSDDLLVVQPPH